MNASLCPDLKALPFKVLLQVHLLPEGSLPVSLDALALSPRLDFGLPDGTDPVQGWAPLFSPHLTFTGGFKWCLWGECSNQQNKWIFLFLFY